MANEDVATMTRHEVSQARRAANAELAEAQDNLPFFRMKTPGTGERLPSDVDRPDEPDSMHHWIEQRDKAEARILALRKRLAEFGQSD